MLLRDIVNQARLILPMYTDKFSDLLYVDSIVANNNIATIITPDPHNLENNDIVNLMSVQIANPIVSISKDGDIFTIVSNEHDLTLVYHTEVKLSGFSDSEWNGTFKLVDVPNRYTFKIQSSNSEPTLSGLEVLLESRIDGIRGDYKVNVVSETEFTVSGEFIDGIYHADYITKAIRIAGVRSIDRAIDLYTKQLSKDFCWGFVSPHARTISKDQYTYSDAVATRMSYSEMRLRLIDGFTFCVFINITKEIAAEEAIDLCRNLTYPIYKTFFGVKFDSSFKTTQKFVAVPTADNEISLGIPNNAFYAHGFDFEVQEDATEMDSVDNINTRAFRDIRYIQKIGTQQMTADINLDDEPIY